MKDIKSITNILYRKDLRDRDIFIEIIKALPEIRELLTLPENERVRKDFKKGLSRLESLQGFYRYNKYHKKCSGVYMNEVLHAFHHGLKHGSLPQMLGEKHEKRADMLLMGKFYQLKTWDNLCWERIEELFKEYEVCDVLSIILMKPTEDDEIHPFWFYGEGGRRVVEIIPYEYIVKEINDSGYEKFIKLLNCGYTVKGKKIGDDAFFGRRLSKKSKKLGEAYSVSEEEDIKE